MSRAEVSPPTVQRSLGDLVAERPARARVLERHGIDYCCCGGRSLRDAAGELALDAAAVAREIEAVADTTDAEVDGLGPAALADHIVAEHHTYLQEELPLLVALAAKVRDVHGARHHELVRVAELVTEICDDLVPHMAKEERVLFPAIHDWIDAERSFSFDPMAAPIQVMLREHDRVGALLAALRGTTSDYAVPDDACASYRALYGRLVDLEADTHRHVHLENNVLFPSVLPR